MFFCIFTGKLYTFFEMARNSSQVCHWWVTSKACEGGRWRGTRTASSKDKTIQLLPPQWHGFKSKTPIFSSCLCLLLQDGWGLRARTWECLWVCSFVQERGHLGVQGKIAFLGKCARKPESHKVGLSEGPTSTQVSLKSNQKESTGGRSPGCEAGFCSRLPVSLAKWHLLFLSFKFVGARHAQMALWMVWGLLWFVVLGTRWEDEGVRKQF